MGMANCHTPGIIGPQLTNGLGTTTLAFRARVISLPEPRRQKHPLWSRAPVVVSTYSFEPPRNQVLTNRTVPLDYWGINQSGPSANTFYAVSVQVRSPLRNH